jgi:hypothetical protein
LGPHEKLTPGFAEKLCFTATATGSYEEAAQVASKWSQTVDDSTLHALVQRVGVRAEGQAQQRYAAPAQERLPQRGPTELGVLLVDGCQLRYRGAGWGLQKTGEDRVEWHELKLGVFYRHEAAARTESGRGLLIDKLVVSWQDQALELGRRLHWEALREGLARAQDTLFLADGAPWTWNLKQDRWSTAQGLLDFYHGSEHLWELGRALHGQQRPALSQWVEPLRHQLRHGKERQVLRQIFQLKKRRGEAGKVIQREQNYFQTNGTTGKSPAAAGPSGLARWNRLVGKNSVVSNAAASSGPRRDCATSALWMKPGAIATGTNFGRQTKDSAKMHPLRSRPEFWA